MYRLKRDMSVGAGEIWREQNNESREHCRRDADELHHYFLEMFNDKATPRQCLCSFFEYVLPYSGGQVDKAMVPLP